MRTHFKKMREVGNAVLGMKVNKAITYMELVLKKEDSIAFVRFTGGAGRHAMGKQRKVSGSHVGWPVKSVEMMKSLLENCRANAEAKGLDTDLLVIKHCQVNQAPKHRRRTYRAHGRIAPYMASPCHVELWALEEQVAVPKARTRAAVNASRITVAKARTNKRIKLGGGLVEDQAAAIEA